jgi:adenosylhomocysteine nucleosidase
MQAKLGLVIALAAEARALLGRTTLDNRGLCVRQLPGGRQLLAAVAGIGTQQAEAAADKLLAQGVQALASVGLAGGLAPGHKAGQIVIASDMLYLGTDRIEGPWKADAAGIVLARDTLGAAGIKIECGTLLTADKAVLTRQQKADLFARTRALTVDMESAAVAGVARRASIPFFGLRAVCDPADVSVAPELYHCLDSNGHIRTAGLMLSVARRPALVGDMLRMGRSFAVARKSLAGAWRVLLDSQLPYKLTGSP